MSTGLPPSQNEERIREPAVTVGSDLYVLHLGLCGTRVPQVATTATERSPICHLKAAHIALISRDNDHFPKERIAAHTGRLRLILLGR